MANRPLCLACDTLAALDVQDLPAVTQFQQMWWSFVQNLTMTIRAA